MTKPGIVTGLFVLITIAIVIDANEVSPTGNFTLEERQAIQKLRFVVEPQLSRTYMKGDGYLIRWLRDQNLDVEKAKKKLLASLNWRKANNIDGVIGEEFGDIWKHCPYSLDGRDKFGRPIITFGIGPCPVRRFVLSGKGPKLIRYFYNLVEKVTEVVEQMQAEGFPVSDIVAIVDLNGFNWREHACLQCIPVEIEMITAYEVHYPRYFQSFYTINTPRIFQSLLSILWPVLSEYSRSIVRIYGVDKNEWQRVIFKSISPEQLPPQYGGTKGLKSSQQ